MSKGMICGLGLAGLVLAGCGTTHTERAATGGLAGAALGAAVSNNPLTGALIGGAAGAAVGYATTKDQSANDRRQYWDARAGRYYYHDKATGRYYWENGEPRS